MRILVDAHVFDGFYHGSRTYIKGLYNALVSHRPDWTFLFAARDTSALQAEIRPRANVQYVQLRSTNKYTRLLIEFPRLIRELEVDYAHFQYIAPLWGGKKHLVTIHDVLFAHRETRRFFPWTQRIVYGPLFRRSARRASMLLTVSRYSREKMSYLYNMSEEEIVVTPNAVEPPVQQPTFAPSIADKYGCANYILYVSRLEPRKNHLGLVQAFLDRDLDKKGYQLVFVGKDDFGNRPLHAYLEKMSGRLSGRLHRFEDVPEEDMAAFYAQSSCVAYPSLAEGFGIPPLEGAVQLRPVVCSNRTAMKEFDFFKYHVDPTDSQALGKALQDALADDDRGSMEQIKEEILKRYNWQHSAEVLAAALLAQTQKL